MSPPPVCREYHRRGCGKSVGSGGLGVVLLSASVYAVTMVVMNTQQLWLLAQDLLKKWVGCRKKKGREGGKRWT